MTEGRFEMSQHVLYIQCRKLDPTTMQLPLRRKLSVIFFPKEKMHPGLCRKKRNWLRWRQFLLEKKRERHKSQSSCSHHEKKTRNNATTDGRRRRIYCLRTHLLRTRDVTRRVRPRQRRNQCGEEIGENPFLWYHSRVMRSLITLVFQKQCNYENPICHV